VKKQFLATNLQFNKDGTVSLLKDGKKRKNKFGNKKVVIDDIQFDSKHEGSFYSHAKMLGIKFELKKKIALRDKFKTETENIRAINMIPDFWILGPNHSPESPEYIAIVDTKGKQTSLSKVNIKLLKEKLIEIGLNIPVFLPVNHSENIEVLMKLQEIYNQIPVNPLK
jgi:hypothetical protein